MRIVRRGLVFFSMVLCVAFIAMWARSWFAQDILAYREPRDMRVRWLTTWSVQSIGGSVCFSRSHMSIAHMFPVTTSTEELESFLDATQNPKGKWSVTHDNTPFEPGPLLRNSATAGWCQWGLGVMRVGMTGDGWIMVALPYWLLVIVAAVWPVGSMLRMIPRRLRLRTKGRCLSCGYDIRATPERCPECGTFVDRAQHSGHHQAS